MKINYKLKIKGFHKNQLNKTAWLFLLWAKKEYQEEMLHIESYYPPHNIKQFTVIKSPDVNKSAREQFKIDFKSLIFLIDFELKKSMFFKIINKFELLNKNRLAKNLESKGIFLKKKLLK